MCLHVKSPKTGISVARKERVSAENPGVLYVLLQASIEK